MSASKKFANVFWRMCGCETRAAAAIVRWAIAVVLCLLLAAPAAVVGAACPADNATLAADLAVLPGLTNLTTCSDMQPFCTHPLLGYFVRNACPTTCGVTCMPPPSDEFAGPACEGGSHIFSTFAFVCWGPLITTCSHPRPAVGGARFAGNAAHRQRHAAHPRRAGGVCVALVHAGPLGGFPRPVAKKQVAAHVIFPRRQSLTLADYVLPTEAEGMLPPDYLADFTAVTALTLRGLGLVDVPAAVLQPLVNLTALYGRTRGKLFTQPHL